MRLCTLSFSLFLFLAGILKAAQLTWPDRSGTRIIHHFADDCPHGTIYHGSFTERYASHEAFPNGHPSDPPLRRLFEILQANNIIYKFMKCNEHCAKMIEIFSTYTEDEIETYNTEDLSMIADSIGESVQRSVTTALETKRNKTHVPLSNVVPDWSLILARRAYIYTYELPDSIKSK